MFLTYKYVGCIYADIGCIYVETIVCIYAEAVWCIYADVGCLSMERLGASLRMLGACTRILCMHKNLDILTFVDTFSIIVFAPKDSSKTEMGSC